MKLNRFLIKSKVCDPDGSFSHISLLLMVAIIRLAIFPADVYTVSILTLALAHSNAKRYVAHKNSSKVMADSEKLAQISAEVQKLVSAQSLKNLGR